MGGTKGWEETDETMEGGMECQVIRGKRGEGDL